MRRLLDDGARELHKQASLISARYSSSLYRQAIHVDTLAPALARPLWLPLPAPRCQVSAAQGVHNPQIVVHGLAADRKSTLETPQLIPVCRNPRLSLDPLRLFNHSSRQIAEQFSHIEVQFGRCQVVTRVLQALRELYRLLDDWIAQGISLL